MDKKIIKTNAQKDVELALSGGLTTSRQKGKRRSLYNGNHECRQPDTTNGGEQPPTGMLSSDLCTFNRVSASVLSTVADGHSSVAVTPAEPQLDKNTLNRKHKDDVSAYRISHTAGVCSGDSQSSGQPVPDQIRPIFPDIPSFVASSVVGIPSAQPRVDVPHAWPDVHNTRTDTISFQHDVAVSTTKRKRTVSDNRQVAKRAHPAIHPNVLQRRSTKPTISHSNVRPAAETILSDPYVVLQSMKSSPHAPVVVPSATVSTEAGVS